MDDRIGRLRRPRPSRPSPNRSRRSTRSTTGCGFGGGNLGPGHGSRVGQWTKSPERVDQQSKPRPANAVLLPVLDPGDHGLIDAGIRLEHALRPAQRVAASFHLGPDQIEPVLFLRITLPIEPTHGASLATTTYPLDIRRSPAAHLGRPYAVHWHQQCGCPGRLKSSIKIGLDRVDCGRPGANQASEPRARPRLWPAGRRLASGQSASGRTAAGRPDDRGRLAMRNGRQNAFRGSVELMMQTRGGRLMGFPRGQTRTATGGATGGRRRRRRWGAMFGGSAGLRRRSRRSAAPGRSAGSRPSSARTSSRSSSSSSRS